MRRILTIISGLFIAFGMIFMIGTYGAYDNNILDFESLVLRFVTSGLLVAIGFGIAKSEGLLNV